MKMLLLLSMMAPAIAFADKIDWHELQNPLDAELSDRVIKKAPKASEEQKAIPPGREGLYLNTLDRLRQIEAINQLPATAAGHDNRACKYAKNVLLEYQLAWDQQQNKGYEAADEKRAEAQISTWKKKVKESC